MRLTHFAAHAALAKLAVSTAAADASPFLRVRRNMTTRSRRQPTAPAVARVARPGDVPWRPGGAVRVHGATVNATEAARLWASARAEIYGADAFRIVEHRSTPLTRARSGSSRARRTTFEPRRTRERRVGPSRTDCPRAGHGDAAAPARLFRGDERWHRRSYSADTTRGDAGASRIVHEGDAAAAT